MYCRIVLISLWLALALPGPSLAWPPGEGAYRPSPQAENWLYEMLAHKARLDHSARWLLGELQSNPATRRIFASVDRDLLLDSVRLHDYTKVHPEQMRSQLPFNEYLPELFARFIAQKVRPEPYAPGLPQGEMTPGQKMQWVIDNMNVPDTLIEDMPLKRLNRYEAMKYKFIIFVLDSLDTGLMRGDITTGRELPSAFFARMQNDPEYGKKLKAFTPFVKHVIPTLQWAEAEMDFEVIENGRQELRRMKRYVHRNHANRNQLIIPKLRELDCFRAAIRVPDLMDLPTSAGASP